MKICIMAALALTLPQISQAAPEWAAQLDQYKTAVASKSTAKVVLLYAGNSTAVAATCSASIALTAASFIAETTPVVNGLSEVMANAVDENYKTNTYKSLMSWEALTQAGRGVAGGGLVAVKDTMKFVVLYLSGQESRAYEGVKKMYASSLTTANALFAQQGKCMMSLSKVLILRMELSKRGF